MEGQYSNLKVPKLRELAKEAGIKNAAKARRSQLIRALQNGDKEITLSPKKKSPSRALKKGIKYSPAKASGVTKKRKATSPKKVYQRPNFAKPTENDQVYKYTKEDLANWARYLNIAFSKLRKEEIYDALVAHDGEEPVEVKVIKRGPRRTPTKVSPRKQAGAKADVADIGTMSLNDCLNNFSAKDLKQSPLYQGVPKGYGKSQWKTKEQLCKGLKDYSSGAKRSSAKYASPGTERFSGRVQCLAEPPNPPDHISLQQEDLPEHLINLN